MTKRQEVYQAVGLLVLRARDLERADAEFGKAQAEVYRLLNEAFPLHGEGEQGK